MPVHAWGGRFRALGPIEVDDARGSSLPMRSSIRRQLLGIFLSEPFVDLRADRVVDQLWYDDPPLGRGSLHVQVSRLRKDLASVGASPIATVSSGYRFEAAPMEVDWLFFQDLAAEARGHAENQPDRAIEEAQLALALWRGDAFEDVLGCPIVDDRARQLEADRRTLTLDLAGLLEACGRHHEAVQLLDPVWSAERFDEQLAIPLARNLHLAGRLEPALTIVAETRQALEVELRATPSPPLIELERSLRERPGEVRPRSTPLDERSPRALRPLALPAAASSPLIGRRSMLDDLVALVAGSTAPAIVEVLGPSGFGKTTLALHVARAVERDGRSVRFGRFTPIPAATGSGLRGAFSDLLGTSTASPPSGEERVTASEIGRSLATDITLGLDQANASGPLLLVADDLGDADAVDRRGLDALVAVDDRPWHVVVLATCRSPLVGVRTPDHTIELGPLSVSEVADALGTTAEDELVQAIDDLAGGHPLTSVHVLERLRAVEPADRLAAVRSFAADPSASGLRYPQLARCSPNATRTIQVLAAFDGPIPAGVLEDGLGLNAEAVSAATIELIDEGLAVELRDGSLAASHAVLASTVRTALGSAQVTRIRAELLEVASKDQRWRVSLGDEDPRRTRHDELVEDLDRALRWGAVAEASAIAEVILTGDPQPHHAVRALLAQAEHAEWAGEPGAGREGFRAAYELGRRLGDDRSMVDAVRGELGIWSSGAGPSDDQAALVDAALAVVRARGPRSQLLSRAVALHLGIDPRSQPWAEEALALAEEGDDPQALAMAACAYSNATLGDPDPQRRHRLLVRVQRSTMSELEPERLLSILAHGFVAATELGNLDEADDLVRRHHAMALRSGRPLHEWRDQVFQATLAMACCRLTDARRAIDEAASISRRHRLRDGRLTELLQRAALAMWADEVEVPGYRPIARLAPDDLLAHAIDAYVLAEAEPATAIASLGRASAGVEHLRPTYLRWATVAATGMAAARLGDGDALAAARRAWSTSSVVVPVLAVGTAALPTLAVA